MAFSKIVKSLYMSFVQDSSSSFTTEMCVCL